MTVSLTVTNNSLLQQNTHGLPSPAVFRDHDVLPQVRGSVVFMSTPAGGERRGAVLSLTVTVQQLKCKMIRALVET